MEPKTKTCGSLVIIFDPHPLSFIYPGSACGPFNGLWEDPRLRLRLNLPPLRRGESFLRQLMGNSDSAMSRAANFALVSHGFIQANVH